MGLQAGAKLGPYEIVCPLGAGGMGEVYRARDTRLERTVAVKVLNSALVASPDLKARFEREARTISQLNHPNICVLHDIGHEGDVDFLVMEFLEGESLAERIRNKGAVPTAELIRIGCEVAEALDKAHRAGIVHRDLKPGNIMLTKTGAKLLDFGLAKPATMGAAASSGSAPLLSAAMTLTSPSPLHSPLTQQGALVGTVHYMSPEQIQGLEADARSDIFAFGAVLYEMATGKRPFEGKSQIKVASAILEDEPAPVNTNQKATPAALDHVIRACLAKDPDRRFQSALDVKLELEWISASPAPAEEPSAKRGRREWFGWIAAAICSLALVAGVVLQLQRPRSPSAGAVRFSVDFPTTASGTVRYTFSRAAISPDGKMLAFVVVLEDGTIALALRNLSSLQSQLIPHTEGAREPFWSPDSRFLGFEVNGDLEKVAVSAAAIPERICAIRTNRGVGASWNSAGEIVFVSDGSLYRVDAVGGTPKLLKEHADNERFSYPQFLPDGRHLLYVSLSNDSKLRGLYVLSVDGGIAQRIGDADYRTVYSAGYLLTVFHGELFATPFDAQRLRITGAARKLPDRVATMYAAFGYSNLDASQNGTLAYLSRATTQQELTWLDRSGRALRKVGPPGEYRVPVLSPDGTKLVFDRLPPDGPSEVWVLDLEKETLTRITNGQANDYAPAWSPDGATVAFSSDRDGPLCALYAHSADGQGADQLLLKGDFDARLQSWGKTGMVVALFNSDRGFQLFDPDQHKLTALQQGGNHAQFSPDGKFLAYQSNASGTTEVYVRAFPITPQRWRVSTKGGFQPLWKRDGSELYYLRPDGKLVGTRIQLGDAVKVGNEQVLFQSPFHSPHEFDVPRSIYAVSPDGSRFLFPDKAREASSSPTVVLNWPALLEQH